VIRLRVPGALEYRDLVVRAVAAACRLVSRGRDFADQVVSAAGEAFNNAALHGYRGRPRGDVDIEIEVAPDRGAITIRMIDYGNSYAFDDVPEPDLDALPESGLGVYIIRSFMDVVTYRPGAPNVLSMTKSLGSGSGSAR
jgi:serine/threonine-protein kinase RsbW